MTLLDSSDASKKYEFNIKRLPDRRQASRPSSSASSRPSTPATFESYSDSGLPSSPATTIDTMSMMHRGEQKPFLDRCLLIRTLHASCGHITHLALHERPCKIPHYGIVASTSRLAQVGCCEDMAVHLVVNRRPCEDCKESQSVLFSVEKTGGWLSRKWNGKADEVPKVNENALPMKTIVERRERWLRDVEGQEARIARKKLERLKPRVRGELGLMS